MLAISVALLMATNYGVLACECVLICGLYIASHIPLRQALRAIAPLAFIVIATAILNIFFVQGGTVYATWGIITISSDGIASAVFLSIRLTLMLCIACLLTLTTTSQDITSAFESILSPLAHIGIPTYDISQVMGMTLSFLPQIIDEWRTIRSSQLSRGAELSIHGGTQKLSSLIIPLFTSAFRHAETLSLAMDARCYHGNIGRTRLHPLAIRHRDIMALCVIVVNFVACTGITTMA